jgi:cysteine synthase B
MGTSGTLMGTGKRLREINGGIQLVAVQPEGPFHGLEGLKHMETSSHVPALYDAAVPDKTVGISTEAAQQMARRMTREEGLYIGVSAGAAICAALKVASTIQEGVLVVICPDAGARYQSEKFWEAT